MSTLELKQKIAEHLAHIDDFSFLKAINTILESKVSENIYKLNDSQKDRINTAREQLKNKQTISHDDIQKEIDQWLSSK